MYAAKKTFFGCKGLMESHYVRCGIIYMIDVETSKYLQEPIIFFTKDRPFTSAVLEFAELVWSGELIRRYISIDIEIMTESNDYLSKLLLNYHKWYSLLDKLEQSSIEGNPNGKSKNATYLYKKDLNIVDISNINIDF